jgi:hypothetical protein
MIESVGLTALGAAMLLASTVKVERPTALGRPERTPADDNVKPLGSDPLCNAKVGGGEPEATKVYEYGDSAVPVGGLADVNVGGTGA